MDLSALSDDEIIAEMQRRLQTGTRGFEGLLSPHQLNYRDRWREICQYAADLCNAPLDPAAHRTAWLFQKRLQELAGTVPDATRIFALNTTRYDRPLDEITNGSNQP